MELSKIPKITEFIDEGEDAIFRKKSKEIIKVSFSKIYGHEEYKDLELFVLKPKRAYSNNPYMCPYINYFIKYFDKDNELLNAYLDIKFMIDRKEKYPKKLFISDLYEYLLSDTMVEKMKKMTNHNQLVDLDGNFKSRKSKKSNDSIKITNKHGKILLNISLCMKIITPLIVHYAHVYSIKNVNKFIILCYDGIASYFEGDTDIYNKLYQMITSQMSYHIRSEKGHWNRVAIEGKDPLNQIDDILSKLVINVVNTYDYSQNIVYLNIVSIRNMIGNIRRSKSQLNYSMMGTKKDQDGLSDRNVVTKLF